MNNRTKIETKNLTKIYEREEEKFIGVYDINLTINEGEFVGILGHSGAGKTTLLSLMGGLIKPTKGSVYINNVDIFKLDDNELSHFRNKNIGFIFQYSSLIPNFTVMENILLPIVFSKEKKNLREYETRAKYFLERLGLKGYEDKYAYELSGGEQRRVAIARAFINKPEIILADEPTADLDEDTELKVLKFFREIQRKENLTFVLVTHSTEIVDLCLCETVYYMKKGRIYDKKIIA